MPWRDRGAAAARLTPGAFTALLGKELRELLGGWALWLALLIVCPLTGFGFQVCGFEFALAANRVYTRAVRIFFLGGQLTSDV